MCIINRDSRVVVTDLSAEIAALKAKCRVQAKQIAELDGIANDYICECNRLRDKYAEQAAYISKLKEVVKLVSELPNWPGADQYIKVRGMAREALAKIKESVSK